MPKYEIEFVKSASKELLKIDKVNQKKLLSKIESLASNPYPSGIKKLQNTSFYRIRSGD